MPAVDFYIKKNDTRPKLNKNLVDAEGNNPNLTGASVVFIMEAQGATTPKINRVACAVITPLTAEVEYTWVAGNTDTAGEFEGEFEVTDAGGGVQTFPNPRKMRIVITDDLG